MVSSKMSFKPTAKDEKILGYICKNYFCKICNSIIIQCVTLSCGHQYCNYCFDMLMAGTSQSQSQCCPQCSNPIKYAQPNDETDQKIDNLIDSCSTPIHKAYTVALNNRFQKSLERSRMKSEARLHHHQTSLQKNNEGEDASSSVFNSSFDDICKAIFASGDWLNSIDSDQSLADVLKSAGKHEKGKMGTPKTRTKKAVSRRHSNSIHEGIDIDKVNSLFGIYDQFLQHENDNEPKKELAGGDFARNEDVTATYPEEPLEGMRNFTRKSDREITALINETDDVVRLDEHIQQWTQKMKTVLVGNNEVDSSTSTSSWDCKVNDELWKSSNQLVNKLKQLHSKRQEVQNSFSLYLPTLPPPPRSAKLDLDEISDDSEVEEYEEALDGLQESLKTQPVSKLDDDVPPSPRSSRAKLDSVEESGHAYVKENIQFITQMRKYKEALMKIQNREVGTAQEIKELIPIMESTPSNRATNAKHNTSPSPSSKPARSRVTHYSPMRAPSPHAQQMQNQSFSAHTSPMLSRPRTESSYNESRKSSRSPSPFPHHQLLPQLYMRRGRRGNVTGPLYTAR